MPPKIAAPGMALIGPVSRISPTSAIPRSALIVEELANVRIARIAHLLITSTEYDVSILQHDEFGIDQAEPVAFLLEAQVAVVVAHDIFAGQHLDVLQTMRD